MSNQRLRKWIIDCFDELSDSDGIKVNDEF